MHPSVRYSAGRLLREWHNALRKLGLSMFRHDVSNSLFCDISGSADRRMRGVGMGLAEAFLSRLGGVKWSRSQRCFDGAQHYIGPLAICHAF